MGLRSFFKRFRRSPQEPGRPPLSRPHRLLLKAFVRTPASFIAEPFEIFLVTLGLGDATTLLIRRAMGTDGPFIGFYHGPIGLVIWSTGILLASTLLVVSLARVHQKNLLEVRKLEVTGLLLYAALFGYYAYGNLSVSLAAHVPVVFTFITGVILGVLVLSCLVRALSLASPVTTVAVTRSHRVKLMKLEVQRVLDEDRRR